MPTSNVRGDRQGPFPVRMFLALLTRSRPLTRGSRLRSWRVCVIFPTRFHVEMLSSSSSPSSSSSNAASGSPTF